MSAANLTPFARKTLIRMAAGGSLGRDHARGSMLGDRNVVYRWNEIDPPIPAASIQKLIDAGWVEGYQLVEITAKGRAVLAGKE